VLEDRFTVCLPGLASRGPGRSGRR